MSRIALILCFTYIAYLYRSDSKKKLYVTGAIWIPTIWLMIIGSRMISQWFNTANDFTGSEGFEEGNPIDRNIYIVLYILAALVLIRRRVSLGTFIIKNPWLCLFLLYGGVSIIWSDFPVVSFKRYIKAIGNLLIALIVVTEPRPHEAMTTMIRRCAYMLMPLSIVLYKYFPALGRIYHRWSGELNITGVALGKNQLGVICMIFGFSLFVGLLYSWRVNNKIINGSNINDLVILMMTLWLLFKANSSTATGCFIIGIATYWALGTNFIKRNIRLLGIFVVAAIISTALLFYLFDIAQFITSSLNRDTTLTGRTELWDYLIKSGVNPVIGGGYERYWLGRRLDALWEIYWWHPTEAHNGYLETYLDLGFLGVFLLVGLIVAAFRMNRERILKNYEYGRYAFVFFVITICYNITESAFRGGTPIYFIFILAIVNMRVAFSNNTIPLTESLQTNRSQT